MDDSSFDESRPQWRFNRIPDDVTGVDVTQRDQFSNDSIDLVQSLVREATQNSTDQPLGDAPVTLRFAIKTLIGEERDQLANLMRPLEANCKACGLETDTLDEATARILVVEDFGTTGLTGAIDSHDEGNFAGFWRRHGGSNKGAEKGGSHGLGKLVFSTASEMGAIFGLTIREDGNPLLMGQAILNNHRVDGHRLPAHGYWTGTSTPGRIQMPSTAPALISSLSALLGFKRTTETGLSIAVPYAAEAVTSENLLKAILTNYFFPILAGQLIVEVGGLVIDSNNFGLVVDSSSNLDADDIARLDFVRKLMPFLDKEPEFRLPLVSTSPQLDEGNVGAETLDAMRARFKSEDGVVSARLPIVVKPKGGPDQASYVDLFLTHKPEGVRPWALFARGSVVLPEESRRSFKEAAFGAVIVRHPAVHTLLRDAENPAHTLWNAREKLKKNWRVGDQTVRHVRLALQRLHQIMTADMREEYQNLLLDILSVPGEPRPVPPKPTPGPKPPKPPPPPRPRFFSERKVEGGFRLSGGPGAREREFPVRVRLRIAYDVLNGNPFKLHSPFDFDVGKSPIGIAGAKVEFVEGENNEPNVLVFDCLADSFELELSGFDPNRDLVIDPRILP